MTYINLPKGNVVDCDWTMCGDTRCIRCYPGTRVIDTTWGIEEGIKMALNTPQEDDMEILSNLSYEDARIRLKALEEGAEMGFKEVDESFRRYYKDGEVVFTAHDVTGVKVTANGHCLRTPHQQYYIKKDAWDFFSFGGKWSFT